MTVADLIRVCLELDQQVICPRPSCWGKAAELVATLADHADSSLRDPDCWGDWRSIDLSVIRKPAPHGLDHATLDQWTAEQREAVGENVWREFNTLLAVCEGYLTHHDGLRWDGHCECTLCQSARAAVAMARGEDQS